MSKAHEYTQHAEVLMMQAEFASGSARRDLLDAATDMLLRAEKEAAGIGSWKLACIHARQGNHELCERWLKRARDNEVLPGADEIESDPHFGGVRDQTWFRAFIEEL